MSRVRRQKIEFSLMFLGAQWLVLSVICFSGKNIKCKREWLLPEKRITANRSSNSRQLVTWQWLWLHGRFLFKYTSILKSLLILAVCLALSSAIYSHIVLFCTLNHIFLSAAKTNLNNQSDFKAILRAKGDVKAFLFQLFLTNRLLDQ